MPKARIIVAGVALASFMALTVSGSLYLSMLSHGHSFTRIYIGEWVRWIFWALAGPPVVQAGMRLMTPDGVDRRARKRAVGLALVLLPLHYMLGVPFAVWLRPLWPMEMDTDWFVISSSQLPTYLATDLLLFVLLLMAGNTYSVYQRARRVELREARLETDLTRAQLDALRLEIQPHFLFNTLNSIAALIRMNDNTGALKMLLGLSDLMRITVDRPKHHLVPLATEIDFLQRYVDLQQTRFADRLQIEYSIDEACRSVSVPTFLLQPLVENAIRHGATPQAGACRIEIGAQCDERSAPPVGDRYGAGLRPGFRLSEHAGTGLTNTRSRLAQIYGDAATFDIRRGAPPWHDRGSDVAGGGPAGRGCRGPHDAIPRPRRR